MKKSFFPTLILAAFLGATSMQAATTVTIYMKDGSKSDLVIEETGRMLFNGDNLDIRRDATDKIESIAMSKIRKVTFASSTSAVKDNVAETTIFAFPNPVKDRVFLSNVKVGEKVSIYSVQGALLAEMSYDEEGLDLSSLAAGSYVISVNGVSVKVNKL